MTWSYIYREQPQFARFSPWHELRRLQNEINRSFEPEFDVGGTAPAINLWGSAEKIVATMALPGINPASLDLTVHGESLAVSGEWLETAGAEAVARRRERPKGRFSRLIELPFAVDGNGVEAEYKNGIVTVTLPRAAADKPKKIKIN